MDVQVSQRHCEREIRGAPSTRLYLMGLAVKVKATALRFAPVETGAYIRSFYVKWMAGADAHVRVGSTDRKAWWIEFGAISPTFTMHAHAPFRKALKVHGIEFTAARQNRA